MSIGIYKIVNPNGKIYIGQSINIEYRFLSYEKLLRCKNQKKLYNSLMKYGIECHSFEIIEKCDVNMLNERERYWQEYYDVINNGLNLKLTNSNDRRCVISEETKNK